MGMVGHVSRTGECNRQASKESIAWIDVVRLQMRTTARGDRVSPALFFGMTTEPKSQNFTLL